MPSGRTPFTWSWVVSRRKKVVFPEEDGPATATMRTLSWVRISSATAAIRFSWKPSATSMSVRTSPVTQARLKSPTLAMPSPSSHRRSSAVMSAP
jgi:hypothetical protein